MKVGFIANEILDLDILGEFYDLPQLPLKGDYVNILSFF